MSKVMAAADLAQKAKYIADNYKTLYVMGCFGSPLTAANKARYCVNHPYNTAADRKAMIVAASADTFGFDCVNLIKGILWGWTGDPSKSYGGAQYAVHGVPDVSADGMIHLCEAVSSRGWTDMEIGEAVWMPGHIGVYIGDGLAVECTPAWTNKVQVTAVGNIGAKAGYNTRTWTKHRKIPYVDYTTKGEDEMLTYDQWKDYMNQYRQELRDNDSGEWSQAARQFAVDHGIFAGSGTAPDGTLNFMWEDFVTREQCAQLLYTFAQRFGLA